MEEKTSQARFLKELRDAAVHGSSAFARTGSLSGTAARVYARIWLRHPIATSIVTLALIVVFVIALVVDNARTQAAEAQRRQSAPDYAEQQARLDGVQASLKTLVDFVSQQKTKLAESEQVVARLKEEQTKLEPVVKAERDTVNAILAVQDQRREVSVRRERWIGIGFGVAGSFVASILYGLAVVAWRQFSRRRRAGCTPQSSDLQG
jgi:predicted PurR-regulated permease PerM